MNARSHAFSLSLDGRQVEEAAAAVVHSLLLHRSLGKFAYSSPRNYAIGSLGTEDVDCETIDLTYARLSSDHLAKAVADETRAFRDALAAPAAPKAATLALEFYQKRRRQWPLPEDVVPWEVWSFRVSLLTLSNQTQRERVKESVGEAISDIVLALCGLVNRPQYCPKMPVQADLATVFDTRFPDCQPFLFRLRHATDADGAWRHASSPPKGALPGGSLGTTMKKLLKDTLSM